MIFESTCEEEPPEAMSAVLIVDRDLGARRGTLATLRYGSFECETTGTLKEAERRLRRRPYAALVVDPGDEPAGAGVSELRARTDVPIIVVRTHEHHSEAVECLNAGADDFLVRPFDPEELLARLRAVLRRSSRPEDELPVVTPDFTIDVSNRLLVRSDGREVSLSPIQWKLVEVLVHRSGHLVTREELLQRVWGPDAIGKPHYLRVQMACIRQKVEPDPAQPRYFVTAPGLGLKFDPSAEGPAEPIGLPTERPGDQGASMPEYESGTALADTAT